MLKSVFAFFKRHFAPTAPCDCGGTVHEELDWGNAFYRCDRCKGYISERDFDHRRKTIPND